MTKKEYETLMYLIETYGDACEKFGDYESERNSALCGDAFTEIENFLKIFVKED